MKQFSILLISMLLLMACKEQEKQDKLNQLYGLWSLYAMEQQDSISGKWSPWRGGMDGYILYDGKDGMALHLFNKDYKDFDEKFPNFNDSIPIEALKHLTKSYVYFAHYTIDQENSVVEHARVSHSNPAEWNDKVRRKFYFVGDTLFIEPVEKQNSSLRLKWIKNE